MNKNNLNYICLIRINYVYLYKLKIMNNKLFIDLENDECEGYWISRDELIIDENVISKGKFEIENDVFNYVKIFY